MLNDNLLSVSDPDLTAYSLVRPPKQNEYIKLAEFVHVFNRNLCYYQQEYYEIRKLKFACISGATKNWSKSAESSILN